MYSDYSILAAMAKRNVHLYDAATRNKVNYWFEKFFGTTGQPGGLGVGWSPALNYYEGIPLIAPFVGYWPSTYTIQFPAFFFKVMHSNPFYFEQNNNYLLGKCYIFLSDV